MKYTTKIITVLLLIMLFMPIRGNSFEDHHHQEDHSRHSISDNHEDGLGKLHLNHGNKWEMDEHTRVNLAQMSAYFLNMDITSLSKPELIEAGEYLQNGINELVTGCTMEGEAHDQLHVFLLSGYIPAVADLYETGDIKVAERVKHYLEIYADYFE